MSQSKKSTMKTRKFDMSHVTNKASDITVQLYNICCKSIHKDKHGEYVWEGISFEDTFVVAKKMYIATDQNGIITYLS